MGSRKQSWLLVLSLSLSHTLSLPYCTMLLVAALTVLLAGLVAEARVEVSETSMEHLQLYVLREKCWGEAAMAEYIAFQEKAMKKCGLLKGSVPVVQQLLRTPVSTLLPSATTTLHVNPFVTLAGRRKRDTVSAADQAEVVNAVNSYTAQMISKISALRCVMMEMGELDAAGNINIAGWAKESLANDIGSTPAGSDPEFVAKFSNEMSRCYNIYQTQPVSLAANHPVIAEAMRMKVFFDCGRKAELELCAKSLLLPIFKMEYGDGPMPAGLPGDKYDAATYAIEAMTETATPEEQCVYDFYYGKP